VLFWPRSAYALEDPHISTMDQRLTLFLQGAQCCCDVCYVAKSPESFVVKNAGSPVANGVFVRTTADNGLNKDHVVNYERKGGVTMHGDPATFYITLAKVLQGSFWSIWFRPVRDAATETYYYLYQTSTKVNWDFFPPRDGWYISPVGQGVDPPPTLVYDPNFRLERIVSPIRPNETSPDNTDIVCLSESLDEREFDALIREAAASEGSRIDLRGIV
jgi:hypothetical protein